MSRTSSISFVSSPRISTMLNLSLRWNTATPIDWLPRSLQTVPQRRPCYDLAVALLQGIGRDWRAGESGTFVFLLDMNRVFEDLCAMRLEQWFGVPVRTQVPLGTLLRQKPGGILQIADFRWETPDGLLWIGDAKYKRAPARMDSPFAWLDPADVRQLICYGQMASGLVPASRRRLLLLYPVTSHSDVRITETYDGTAFATVPVPVVPGKLHDSPSHARVFTLRALNAGSVPLPGIQFRTPGAA